MESIAGTDVLRFGLIGAGKHGRRYAKHIREDFPDLQLVALARRDPVKGAALASELGCRAYTDYRELLAVENVDAVIIVVPPSLHEQIVTAAAEAGRAILLEKPAAVSLEAGRRMLSVQRRSGVPLMVAHTLRYNAVVRVLRERIPELGAIHSLGLTQRFEQSALAWLDNPATSGGGITLHTGVHSFDLVRVLTGLEADRVSCEMESVATCRTEDNFAACVRLDGGRALAMLSGSRAAPGRTGYIEVAGARGTLVADHVLHHVQLVVGTRAETVVVGEPVPTVREVLREFSRCLRAREPMPIPLEDGLRAVAIAEACYRSARSGTTAAVEKIE